METIDKVSQTSKFLMSIFPMVFFSLFFFALPIYHSVSSRDLQPALKVNIDSLSTIVGVFGVFTPGAILALHRSLSALENSSRPAEQTHCCPVTPCTTA